MNQIEQRSTHYSAQSESTTDTLNREALCARDIMTRRVITLSPNHSLAQTISLMAKHSFRHFLVVDASGGLVGVISDRDILRALARRTDWHGTSVSQFMSHDVFKVKPDTELSLATGKMLSKRINCLPVVDDNNNICGIITSTDLLKTYRSIQESFEKRAKSSKPSRK